MTDMGSDGDSGFLSRWARRKAEARQGRTEPVERVDVPVPPAMPEPPAVDATSAPSAAETSTDTPAVPPPTLDDVARLTPESDFTRFVARDVDPGVKNAALKKLFADPQFNVMDGLDIYIDDYGQPDPLPPGMLRQLASSHALGLFDDDPADDPAEVPAPAAAPEASAPPQEPAPNEDPDLRLQPDDAAGRPGDGDAAPGAGQDPAGQP